MTAIYSQSNDDTRSRQRSLEQRAGTEHELSDQQRQQDNASLARTLLGTRSLTSRGNATMRASTMQVMQQTYGNRAVQRYIAASSQERSTIEDRSNTQSLQGNLYSIQRQASQPRSTLDPSRPPYRDPPPCTAVYCSGADTKDQCVSCCMSTVPTTDPPHCFGQCEASCAGLPSNAPNKNVLPRMILD